MNGLQVSQLDTIKGDRFESQSTLPILFWKSGQLIPIYGTASITTSEEVSTAGMMRTILAEDTFTLVDNGTTFRVFGGTQTVQVGDLVDIYAITTKSFYCRVNGINKKEVNSDVANALNTITATGISAITAGVLTQVNNFKAEDSTKVAGTTPTTTGLLALAAGTGTVNGFKAEDTLKVAGTTPGTTGLNLLDDATTDAALTTLGASSLGKAVLIAVADTAVPNFKAASASNADAVGGYAVTSLAPKPSVSAGAIGFAEGIFYDGLNGGGATTIKYGGSYTDGSWFLSALVQNTTSKLIVRSYGTVGLAISVAVNISATEIISGYRWRVL